MLLIIVLARDTADLPSSTHRHRRNTACWAAITRRRESGPSSTTTATRRRSARCAIAAILHLTACPKRSTYTADESLGWTWSSGTTANTSTTTPHGGLVDAAASPSSSVSTRISTALASSLTTAFGEGRPPLDPLPAAS